MKGTLTIVIGIWVASLSAMNVYSCQCLEYNVPFCEQVSRADTIFVGIVKSIRDSERPKDTLAISLIRFEVEQIYKGSAPSVVDVGYVFGTSCSWNKFEIGERWIVYGYRESPGALLTIPFCTGSHPFGDTSEDATFLNNLRQGKNEESIRGRLLSFGNGPISDASIVITNEKATFTGKSNSEGLFEIGIPGPGKYKVNVSVPFSAVLTGYDPDFFVRTISVNESKSVLEYDANVDKGLCSYRQLDFSKVDLKANGSIGGRLIDFEGNPVVNGFVHLAKWDIQEDATLRNNTFTWTDQNGSFTFEDLREGRYIVLLNPSNFPEKDKPYLRSYLPGVPRFADAFIIELKQGDLVNVPDFRLPQKLPTRTIEINVVWPDGKPVLTEYANGEQDRLPWISIHRADGKYLEHPDATRSGNGKYSFTVYQGFPYVIGVQVTGSNDRFWNGFAEVPSGKISKPLKIVLAPKTGEASEFVEKLKAKRP